MYAEVKALLLFLFRECRLEVLGKNPQRWIHVFGAPPDVRYGHFLFNVQLLQKLIIEHSLQAGRQHAQVCW